MIEESKYIDILTDLYFILAERGYDTKAFPTSDEQPPLLAKLEEQLQKSIIAAAKSKDKESFFIERRGKINETEDIYFKFHFQFNPAKAEVDIHALYAIMANTEKIYIPRYNNDLPSTRFVRDDLNLVQLKKARNIIDSGSSQSKDQSKKPRL